MQDRTETLRQILAEVRAELPAARTRVEAAMRELASLENQERHLAALCGEEPEGPATAEEPGELPAPPPAAADVGVAGAGGAGHPSPRRDDGESFAAGVRRVAREAIRAAGRPLNRAEIFEAVGRAGIDMPARNAAKKISKILSADDGFENVRGKGYSATR